MKYTTMLLTLFILGLAIVMVAGCGTGTPGMTNTLGEYSTTINGPPDKVTEAAEQAVRDLRLTDIQKTESKIDGRVTAKTAQNDNVTITIGQGGGNDSDVSIKVGSMGDEAISNQIFDRIKTNLNKPVAPIEGSGLIKTEPK